MSRIDFYHLQKQSLEEVLPKLLLKAYKTGSKILIKTTDEKRVTYLNDLLWTFQDDSFLPHGCKKDGFGEQQPIWLTDGNDNPNQAEFLFLVDKATTDVSELAKFQRVFNIFDGNETEALQKSREFWKLCKNSSYELHYWQQNVSGQWKQMQ